MTEDEYNNCQELIVNVIYDVITDFIIFIGLLWFFLRLR
jgi:hypothetical protein